MLIALAVFLLECGLTDRQTDETERPTHAGGYASVVNDDFLLSSYSRNQNVFTARR